MSLFHFAPRDANVAKEGILTLEKMSPDAPHWDKYKGRATRRGFASVKDYLLSKRGESGLRCVSASPYNVLPSWDPTCPSLVTILP